MACFWIFVGCYVVAFAIVNIRMSAQTALMKSRLRAFGAADQQSTSNLRAELPLSKELLVRFWAPLVFCIVPAIVICIGYAIFA